MYDRVIDFLESGEFKVKFKWINKNTHGEIDYSKKVITINLSLFITDTIIHEFLHNELSGIKNEEKVVLARTKRVMKRLPVHQIKWIAKRTKEVSSG